MDAIKDSVLVYKGYHVEAPSLTPNCGIHTDIVHTISNIRYCLIYIWFHDKQEFWFFPVDHQHAYLSGYAWNRRYWMETRININYVKSYY